MDAWGGGYQDWVVRTVLAVEYFFSVPMTAPVRAAAFSALFPRTTVSRTVAPGPRVLLPILVTVSQSAMMMVVSVVVGGMRFETVDGKKDADD